MEIETLPATGKPINQPIHLIPIVSPRIVLAALQPTDTPPTRVGGEAASLAIPHKYQEDFSRAGYTALTLGAPDEPPFVPYGLTRQHGNLSFTRVFQAGHMVPSYQPEASLRVFERALLDRDIATGAVDLRTTGGWLGDGAGGEEVEVFRTEGPGDTWWRRSEVLPAPGPSCYILQLMTCSEEEVRALKNGTAVVKDYVLVGIDAQARLGEVEAEDGRLVKGDGSQAVVGVDEL